MHRNFILSKPKVYWLCQFFGWCSLVLVETINYTFVLVGSFQWDYVISFGHQAFYGLLVSHFYKILFIKSATFLQPLKQLFLKGIFDTFMISFIISSLILIEWIVEEWAQPSQQLFVVILEVMGMILNQSRYVVVWIIIYYMYKILMRNRTITEDKLQMENFLTSSELELLKTQLNPHFLFNALNSIKALVLIDANKAQDAIGKLGELLRFSLDNEKDPLIFLKEEIYNVEKYLSLEKIRFGNRFRYRLEISKDALEMHVPPALVLTLAENAIKHGITQLPNGGEIMVKGFILEDNVCLEVTNTGQLQGVNIKGIGLKNVRSRLKHLFGNLARVHIQNQDNDQVLVRIIYPIQMELA